MITLWTAADPDRLLDRFLAEIAAHTERWPDRRAFLIVPESHKADVERRFFRRFGGDVLLMAEVLSFRRLAYRLYAEAGGLAQPRLSTMGRALHIAWLLKSEAASFPRFRHLANRPEFAGQLASLFAEFAHFAIDGDDLRAVSEQSTSRHARARLQELAILSDRLAAGTRGKLDQAGELTRLAAFLRTNEDPRLDFLSSVSVFVSGFGELAPFGEDVLDVLAALADRTASLSIALAGGSGPAYAHAERSRALLGRRFAARLTCRQEREKADGQKEPARQFLLSAPDSREEAAAVAGHIRRLVIEEGFRYRDIAIGLTRREDLRETAAVLEAFAIPAFVDESVPVSSSSFSRLLEAVLQLAQGQDELATLLDLVDNPLFPVAPDDKDRFEEICLTHNLTRLGLVLNSDPASLDEKDQLAFQRVRTALKHYTELRQGLVRQGRGQAACLQTWLAADSALFDRLTAEVEALSAAGQTLLATTLARSVDIWQEALNETAGLLGEARVPLSFFASLLRQAVAAVEVKAIPVGLDRVRVTPLTGVLSQPCRALFVTGVESSNYPVSTVAPSFLGPEERRQLAEYKDNGFSTGAPDLRLTAAAIDRRVRTLPSDLLCFSGPQLTAESLPALLSPLASCTLTAVDPARPGPGWYALNEARRRLRLHGHNPAVRAAVLQLAPDFPDDRLPGRYREAATALLSPALAKALLDYAPVSSATTLETYNSCPYRTFAGHFLGLRPADEGRLDAQIQGVFLHDMLRHSLERLRQRLSEQPGAAADRIIEAWLAGELAEGLESTRRELVLTADRQRLTWLGHDVHYGDRLDFVLRHSLRVLARLMIQRGWRPQALEWRFPEKAETALRFMTGGTEHVLRGTIDRVDVDEDGHFFILDYKRNKQKLLAEDVADGLTLQLPLYEQAWALAHPQMPAGGYLYVDLNRWRDSFGVDDGASVVQAMEKSIVSADSLEVNVLDVVQATLGRMQKGEIGARPRARKGALRPCKYCEYAALCGVRRI